MIRLSKKAIFYISFFVLLIAVFYIVVQKWITQSSAFSRTPFYTTIAEVQPFSFTDQDGKIFTNKDVEGKVYVAEYFYTTCTAVCPRMNANMKTVYDRLKDKKDFFILSFTCNPETDSALQLKKYSQKLGVNTDRWIFLTGRKDSLYHLARFSFHIDDPANNLKDINDQFLHSQLWALVDKEGKVKKIYDGLKKEEVDDLVDDVLKMLKD